MPAVQLTSIANQSGYAVEAFLFVQRGLDFTVKQIHGEPDPAAELEPLDPQGDVAESSRHVGGAELCLGLRDYALQQYGLLARLVLTRWGIRRCEDFGRIVFAMVEAGLMHKTDEDRLDDFVGVFDFKDAFGRSLLLPERA